MQRVQRVYIKIACGEREPRDEATKTGVLVDKIPDYVFNIKHAIF